MTISETQARREDCLDGNIPFLCCLATNRAYCCFDRCVPGSVGAQRYEGVNSDISVLITIPTAVLRGVYLVLWAPYDMMGLTATFPFCITMRTAVLRGVYLVLWAP